MKQDREGFEQCDNGSTWAYLLTKIDEIEGIAMSGRGQGVKGRAVEAGVNIQDQRTD